MRLAVTGTPGTGKTVATRRLEGEVHVVHLNDEIRDEELWTERDDDRGSLVADLDAVREFLGDWEGVVDSHLAHYLDAERVVVLRCEPSMLDARLRERGESREKAYENAESEALDVILSEAVTRHGEESVYEVDTTDLTPDEVADAIRAVLTGEREPSAGEVDFTGWLG